MKKMFFVSIAILVLSAMLTIRAWATDYYCNAYPEMCADVGKSAGSSYPSAASTMNSNPSFLPTIPLPPGIEFTYNTKGDYSKSGLDVAGVKGLPRYGIGFATQDNNNFYSYNLEQAFQGTGFTNFVNGFYAANTIHKNFNLAGSYALFKNNPSLLPVAGLNLIYDESTHLTNLGYGLSFSTPLLSLGASYAPSRGLSVRGIPATSTTQLSAGLRLGNFNIDYSELKYRTTEPLLQSLTLFSESVRYFTISGTLKKIHFTASRREAFNVLAEKVSRILVSVQWQASSHIGFSYTMNYVLGAHSFATQILF